MPADPHLLRLSGDDIQLETIMKYTEDKRTLRRIEHTTAGLVFAERKFRTLSRPLLLNKDVLVDGHFRRCTLNWMPIKKCWSISAAFSYGHNVYMKPIHRVKRLSEVWAIVIDMVPKS